jgi:hypothetical protein
VTVGSTGLIDLGRATVVEVDAFAQRFAAHRERAACLKALADRTPDLALALYRRAVRAGDLDLAGLVAPLVGVDASLTAARRDPAHHRAAWEELARAEAARDAHEAKAALERAALARTAFKQLGDAQGEAEANLIAVAGDPDEASRATLPELVATADEARLLLVRSAQLRSSDGEKAQAFFARVLRHATGSRDGSLVLLVEAQRADLAGPLDPATLGAWLRHVGDIALERGHPLVALRCGFEAREVNDGRDGLARAIVARAQLALGQSTLALETALELTEAAHGRGDASLEGVASSVVGEALVACDRDNDAAAAFERAAQLATRSGEAETAARRTLNAARAHLRRGDNALARACVEAVFRVAPERSRLAARAGLIRVIELAQRKEFAEARDGLEAVLALAAATGDFETVEQGEVLKKRLGARGA